MLDREWITTGVAATTIAARARTETLDFRMGKALRMSIELRDS
jgi:hypothetical protein